ncbi:MAG: hypothetical protein R3A51_10105 [Nannocystaceae bacterium]|nr:hypothetical protein [Myxococcales bacterium]
MAALAPLTKFVSLSLGLTMTLLAGGCLCGPGPNVGGYDDGGGEDPPKSLEGVKFVESEKGEPEVIGCSDGQREGFADLKKHPRIAGCLGRWEGTKSAREKPTGKSCGDDGGICDVPSDVCAAGWHVCGSDGKNRDLKSHTSWRSCNEEAGPGKFIAAMSHGQTDELCPPRPTPSTDFPCMDSGLCSEPVCCGEGCQFGKCRDAVWPGKTMISLGKAEGCGAISSERNGGLLCCYDGAGAPKPKTPAADPAAADSSAAETDGTVETAGEAAAADTADAKADAKTSGAPSSTAPAAGDVTKAADSKADAKTP